VAYALLDGFCGLCGRVLCVIKHGVLPLSQRRFVRLLSLCLASRLMSRCVCAHNCQAKCFSPLRTTQTRFFLPPSQTSLISPQTLESSAVSKVYLLLGGDAPDDSLGDSLAHAPVCPCSSLLKVQPPPPFSKSRSSG
jgi:hypothetical protein